MPTRSGPWRSAAPLDPAIVAALVQPVLSPAGLRPSEEQLLGLVAEGKPVKAIAAARHVPSQVVEAEVEAVFVKLAGRVSAGDQGALKRLRLLHQAIIDREEQGQTLSRLLPGGLADQLRRESKPIGLTERVVVTVLISDIRSYPRSLSTPTRPSWPGSWARTAPR